MKTIALLSLLLLTGCVTERDYLIANERALIDQRCATAGFWLAQLNDSPPLRTRAAEQERLADIRFYRRIIAVRCLQ